jgi:DNA replication licensing factor MCM4
MSEYNRKRGHIGGGVNFFNNHHMFNHNPASSTGMQGLAGMEPSSNTQVLYGTNINSTEVQQKLRNFLTTFTKIDENAGDDAFTKQPFYVEKLSEIHETENWILDVDCEHLYEFDPTIYRQLENYPTDIIPIFDLVVTSLYKESFLAMKQGNIAGVDSENLAQDDGSNDPIIQVRPYNMRT